jgi:hypothetical protein
LSLWLNLSSSVSAFGRAGNILYDAPQGPEFLADLTLFNINRRHYRPIVDYLALVNNAWAFSASGLSISRLWAGNH